MIFMSAINGLLDRFHNFILPFLRGEDRVCQCTCGSHQTYHVVPYHGAVSMDSRQNYLRHHIMSQQESDMLTGLLLGLCFSWFLLWLLNVWNVTFKFCWVNQLNRAHFCSWMPKISDTMTLQCTEDSTSEIFIEASNTWKKRKKKNMDKIQVCTVIIGT